MRSPDDHKAVAELAEKILIDDYDEEECQHYMRRWDTVPAIRVTVTDATLERAALENAARNNFRLLFDLAESGHSLSPKGLAMMASKARGTFKAKRGPQKQTLEQRELKPEHWAAKEVKPITAILRQLCPRARGHREWAITIAAKRAGLKRQAVVTELGSRHRRP